MPPEDEWVQAFQDCFFGKMHPRTFLIIWSPVTYSKLQVYEVQSQQLLNQ